MEILRQDVGVDTTVSIDQSKKQEIEFDLEDLYLILQMNPYDSLIATKLAGELRELGRFEEALKIMRNVVKIDSSFQTLNALAQVEYQLEMLDQAFEHLQQAMLIAPENSQVMFEIFKTLGNIFVRRGDFDSAEDSYNKAHRINSTSDVLFVNIGTLAIQRAAWDEAVEKFREALHLNLTNDKAWVGLAIGHRMKGDFDLSWGNLEAALEYNPLNETALGLALDWSTYDGREFRVLELIRNFLVEGGWSERLSLAFAWLSFRRGERLAAKLELERLLAVNPENEQAIKLIEEMRQNA